MLPILAAAFLVPCALPPTPVERGGDTVQVGDAPVSRDRPPFDASPGGTLKTLFEKTFLHVDVLLLEIQVDAPTTARLQRLSSRSAAADSVAQTVIEAPEAWVRMEFLRSVSQSKFFGGIRDNLARARRAGLITADHERRVSAQLPEWYGFLAKRGVKHGDILVYSIRGALMKTTYYSPEGTVLFNYTQQDPEARYGVLGSYLAPGSDFRDGLLKSLPHPKT
jgi:hypothetical protein